MANAVKGIDIQRVLDEADQAGGAGAARVAIADIPDFCAIYRSQVRPALLLIIKVLKFLKPEWADILAKVVAFLDTVCP